MVQLEAPLRLLYCILMSRELSITFVHLAMILPHFFKIAVLIVFFLTGYAAAGCILFHGAPSCHSDLIEID